MSSNLTDVSNKLGEYMLKGWVLTDQSCKTPSCSVPLMRSPKGTPVVHFCVNCDSSPGEPRQKPLAITTSASSSSRTSDSNVSRSSTPPTEVSSALSSPVFASPADNEETRRRREQSDAASAEIGKRLLKGWAMLGDECLNTRCFGVPLVRPPKAGGEKDPRKECVVCGRIYVTEVDQTGRERLILTNPSHSEPTVGTSAISMEVNRADEYQNITSRQPAMNAPVNVREYGGCGLELVLDESASALQGTLRSLSSRLNTMIGTPNAVDPLSIGVTADAISKVVQAISHVRQLQWSENQAHGLELN
ncbi:hypothetical protein H0H92_010512 [Tricholoma furcatifolium]|nr:hypothetical protein H0H92_010512 [Tricholoma furcatifolium]